MRIITWNCQGCFRKKANEIAAYKPDIVIIQECEIPDILFREKGFPRPTHHAWFGAIKHKGLCVMSYTGLELCLYGPYAEDIQYCVPLRVKGHLNINLIAVWTQHHHDKNSSYIGQAFKAVKGYQEFICSDDTLLVGDFNSNQIWDKKRSVGNHTQVVNELKKIGIVSVYHEHYRENHGSEKIPTFYMYRKLDKPYHIDYCFAPTSWTSRIKSFYIGEYEKWCHLSDHVPLIIEFSESCVEVTA